ncbi:NigD-like protein [Dysgonomonas sp. ZJ279]|uniref:NigD-like protein n=1 Tax=Dysgonomonas sp. ZJ279 TaxID=2709796 RepID=UPI0013EBC853|nr:NigD-like protein [Dysgonomonas sp. ZJ279]
MKKLVKLFSVLFFCGVLALGISSCSNDDGHSLGDFYLSWATTNDEGRTFMLDDKDSTTLFVSATSTNYQPKNKRVVINFTILSDQYNGYDHLIKLNGYVADVLTKNVIYLDPNDQAQQDSIGNDPIEIKGIWEGGGYLNIKFAYLTANQNPHLINLISTKPDKSVTDDVVELEFRHNREGDPQNYMTEGLVSFDLAPYSKEGRDTVAFKIKVKLSDTETKIYDIEYKYGKP